MKNIPVFDFFVLTLFVQVYLVSGQCSSEQHYMLLQLKKSLIFEPRFLLQGWNQTSADCCTWTGVTCEEGLVTGLDLHGNIFSGELSCLSSLFNLQYLKILDLSGNHINDHKILSCICNLKNLEYLALSFTNLTGSIPSFHNCKFLTELDLSYNFLSGSIPSSLFSHPSLQKVWLHGNQLSGQLYEFPNASSSMLHSLDLSGNKLVGQIPISTLKLMRQLRVIFLSSNKFSGTIEKNMTQGLDNLNYLDLSYNNLSIKLASDSFTNITWLGLASCKLQEFPPLMNLSNIKHLDLSNNEIYGEIPNWIWEIGPFLSLNLSFNKLEFFQEPYSLANVSSLDLHNNHLRGKIPTLPPKGQFIDLSINNFTSSIPKGIGSLLSATFFFSLSNNELTGVIPESICNIGRGMRLLDLSDNNLSGQIPPCIIEMTHLEVLDLQRNKFSGQIPDSFSDGCALKSLYVNGNSIEGPIPSSLSTCSELEVLDLGNNKLVDSFPCFLNKISTLRVLVLRSNYLYGGIGCQETDRDWAMLQIVDLAHNNFSSELLGRFFKNWQAMMVGANNNAQIISVPLSGGLYYQDAVEVIHKGQEYELVKILTIYTSIDLSCNNLQGLIPEELGELQLLHFLNLSHNSFVGPIPASVGKLKQLESFDVSMNQLSETIPASLANLNFLSVFNLSHNQLEGMIPTGNQLQLFTADSFFSNKRLCGPPLTMNCSNSDESLDDAPRSYIDWDVIAAVIGFIFGFGIINGPLVLCNRWRKWYFERVEDIAYWIFPRAILRKWWSWKTQRQRR